MIQKMLTKLPLYLDKIKLITEEKIKYTQQLKFIIHQEENQVFNLVERINHDFNPSIIFKKFKPKLSIKSCSELNLK